MCYTVNSGDTSHRPIPCMYTPNTARSAPTHDPTPILLQGYWKEGNTDGKGVFDYAGGDRYRGEFKANKKHGRGAYVWANGNRQANRTRDTGREEKKDENKISKNNTHTLVTHEQNCKTRCIRSFAVEQKNIFRRRQNGDACPRDCYYTAGIALLLTVEPRRIKRQRYLNVHPSSGRGYGNYRACFTWF